MPESFTPVVTVCAEVYVFVGDEAPSDLFSRAEEADFQRAYYGDRVKDRKTVLEHWAYNATANGVIDVSRLDGWGDLERGMVTLRVETVWTESVDDPGDPGN